MNNKKRKARGRANSTGAVHEHVLREHGTFLFVFQVNFVVVIVLSSHNHVHVHVLLYKNELNSNELIRTEMKLLEFI